MAERRVDSQKTSNNDRCPALPTRTTIERLKPAMKFVLACYGTRGDVEPGAAVGRELLRRGHDVRMAVSPNMVGFAESAGLAAVAYGLDTQAFVDAQRNYWTCRFRSPWRVHELNRLAREFRQLAAQCWGEMTTTLTSLADGADLLYTGLGFEDTAANVAEYLNIPLATQHIYPARGNGHLVPFLPAPLIRSAWTMGEWINWRGVKKVEDAQRRELGLPKATGPAARRITERGSLEIQAYDEVCFPGLAAEWAEWDGQRPFVGALTMELPTDADEEVASWIAAGTPPIYFGFGSMVESAADTLAMISAACAQLGERALVCAGWSDFSNVPHFEHVKVVGAVNYAAIFPACRAVVHHGGVGTTAAGLRAGVPTLILWTLLDQPLWGAAVKRLKVGTYRRFSTTTEKSLVADLRTILAPQYLTRARQLANGMTKSAESAAAAADLVENFARLKRDGSSAAGGRDGQHRPRLAD
jgi:UDP:flavonoid glycosyltransferase YjiC (YdhE family)